MVKSARFILSLTLRLEIYTSFIVVPLTFVFGTSTRHMTPEESKVQMITSLLCTVTMFIIGTIIRSIILSGIMRKIKNKTGDIFKQKLRLLGYPKIELIMISLRWLISYIIIAGAQHAVTTFTIYNYITYILLTTLGIGVNTVISFFATENKISELLNDPRVVAVTIPADSYKPVTITTRILMTVCAVNIIPIIMLGYVLFLSSMNIFIAEKIGARIAVVIILGIITLCVIIYESTHGIRAGMGHTIKTLETLQSGDFGVKDIAMLDRSEIGIISNYINGLALSLKNFVAKDIELNKKLSSLTVALTQNADSLFQDTREEATSIEEMTATIEEISGGAESVVRSVEDQFTAMGSLVNSMSDLSEVMTSMNSRIESVIKISGDIDTTAQSGSTKLNTMIESLKIVSESSAQMTNIIEIINDISDKINLLSLNASIEAARAGDAGRGFAVVADEISKLADMTANSIKDISSLVQRNIDEIRISMKRIDDTVGTINTINKLVNSINAQTDDISEAMKGQHTINEKVTGEAEVIKQKSNLVQTAMKEQKLALDEIVKAISNINAATQNIMQSSEKLVRNSKEVEGMAAGLVKV